MTIMISYSRLDKKEADAIVSDLKATGLKMWQDITDMKPGDEWRQILLRQPMTVNAFIPFLSENYVNSEMCRMELFLARSTNREIFPILLRECWDALDTKEETKYISILFAARMEPLRIVSLPVTREEMIARLAKDIERKSRNTPRPSFNSYISYPGHAGPFATKIRNLVISDALIPWVATLNCEFGSDWRKSQVEAMTASKAHIIIVSSEFRNKNNDVLQTELLMSEALGLPFFCVESPELGDPDEHSRVYSFLRQGSDVLRRITQRNWYRESDLDALKQDILQRISA